MTVVTGQGSDGNTQPVFVFSQNAYVISAQTASSFTVTNANGFGSAVFTGTGFSYNGNTLTAGTITGVSYSRATNPGPSTQTWTGLSVSAVTALALAQSDTLAFNQLLFGGNDTITFTTLPVFDPTLDGFDGNDVFNISDWSKNGYYIVDGGNGNDTLNVTGGIVGTSKGWLAPTNFDVINVETVNLGAGYNYAFVLSTDFVASGKSATINGSALGPANSLVVELLWWMGPIYGDLVLIGGAGNDIFDTTLGSTIFNGGAGSDTVQLFHRALDDLNFSIGSPPGSLGYVIDLGLNTPQSLVTSGQLQGTATFIDIENLAGSPLDDTLTGNASDNILAPGAGMDVLNGRGGQDTVWYSFPLAGATITYSGRTVTITAGAGNAATLTGIELAHFSDQTIRIAGPVVTTANAAATHGHALSLSSLFSATDLTGDPITKYQLWDDNDDPLSGHFVINGVAQSARTIIEITAAQLAQTSFVTGMVGDPLQIRAYDGFSWSAADSAQWSPFAVTVLPNNAPVVTAATYATTPGQTLALSSLFSAIDTDGDTITKYQLWDGTNDPSSGHFVVNGVTQPQRMVIELAATQLAQTSFVTGSVNDNLQIRAFDGISWSAADSAQWSPFTVTVPSSAPPAVINGSGVGNLGPWYVLANTYAVTQADSTTFSANNSYGNLTLTGTGFTYAGTTLTGGSITGIQYFGTASSGAGYQSWSGLSVSAASASNALAAHDMAGFESLFLGGDDAFTWYSPTPSGIFPGGLYGYGGNDTFDVSSWNFDSLVNGGVGADTLNVSGGISAASPTLPNFSVTNVERVNLGAGANYAIYASSTLVAGGATLTLDASALGGANSLSFYATSDFSSSTFAGNITLIGGAGNDILQGGAGTNVFSGGAGSDTVDFHTNTLSYSGPGVTASLSISGPQSIGGPRGGTATFIGIENLTGTVYSDTLTGDDSNNILDAGGGQGDDTLNGLGGDDTFIVDRGLNTNDRGTLDGGLGYDTVVLPAALQFYTISHSGRTTTISGIGIYTLTGVESAKFQDQTIQISGPVVATSGLTAPKNQSVALSTLFSANDLTGDTITKYQLWDGSSDPSSGHFVVNGVVQSSRTLIELTPGQIALTSFVMGAVSDSLQIRAFDGISWSAADDAQWAPFTMIPSPNVAPAVTTANKATAAGQTLALSSLFSVSDADGDAITKYQLWDGTSDPLSGHFVVNGVVQSSRALIEVTAAQLAATSFVAGSVSDTLQIRAFDGAVWSADDNASWAPFTVTPAANAAPVVTTANKSATRGQTLALSSLFSASDADGDAITKYQLWDGTGDPLSGHFVISGVAQPARAVIDITAAQLAATSFVAGAVSDTLQIRAFDGAVWSAADNASWAPFTVTPAANVAPVVTTANKSTTAGQTLALSSLFSVSDFEGDAITKYQLWDSTSDPLSGHFVISGVAQPARAVIDITAAQLAATSFVTGSVNDMLQIRAFDGISWSASDSASWAPFTVTVPSNTAPVVTTANTAATRGQTLALSSLFSVNDADGDAITKYQLWDGTSDPLSGHFVVNGVAQAARTLIELTPGQIALTSFVAGAAADSLQIRAFDGAAWSAPDSASWAPFTVTPAPNNAPVVTTADIAAGHGQTLALSSLFSVSDADGDAITRYQLWDSTSDPLSGHFVVNGVAQPERAVIDLTPSQIALTSLLVGTLGDNLQIRAFDGFTWSAPDSAQWAPFHVTAT